MGAAWPRAVQVPLASSGGTTAGGGVSTSLLRREPSVAEVSCGPLEGLPSQQCDWGLPSLQVAPPDSPWGVSWGGAGPGSGGRWGQACRGSPASQDCLGMGHDSLGPQAQRALCLYCPASHVRWGPVVTPARVLHGQGPQASGPPGCTLSMHPWDTGPNPSPSLPWCCQSLRRSLGPPDGQ